MPLNRNHKKFIDTVIDPLLDVNLNSNKKIKKMIRGLGQAMRGCSEGANEYYHKPQFGV